MPLNLTPKGTNTFDFFDTLFLLAIITLVGCSDQNPASRNVPLDEIAGNEEVKTYMEAFEGRGVQSDDSKSTPAEIAIQNFKMADDLALDLILAEPQIHQPVELNFDHRGRLWVVQYNQYPYPKGVKVVDIDNHVRAVFDKVPQPPPNGVRGADKITIFEDTNGDGTYDKSTDAITGLNIATSVCLGRKKIWVLTPPYLVAYPDPDGDGIPNGDPEVHLEGFGLEDTHAVANSLRWGPDGWLYGAQGSTTHATINSKASKNVHFKGQAIWRYHPESRVFEIFAEGGGNTFHVEIDAKGRVYSGDNGNARGFYYKQGGYYQKNWGKHGALTNPYALGYIHGMDLVGDQVRFTHAWIKYDGGSLPKAYNDKIIAINPLLNFVRTTKLEAQGSSFSNIDEEIILKTEDNWFRPVDIKAGPDGAVYLADWYDSRLSHIDPRDTWNKSTGRIYRLRNKTTTKVEPFDLSIFTSEELVALLTNNNKWFRQQALRLIGDRRDKSILPLLKDMLENDEPQSALEALWAVNLTNGLDQETAHTALNHNDPYVRLWAVRLLADRNGNKLEPSVANKLATLTSSEKQLEVLGQLASTAKRLTGSDAIPIISGLLQNQVTAYDRDNRLFIWWTVESKAISDRAELLALFEDKSLWEQPLVKEFVLYRLIQRYALEGGYENYSSCAKLFELSPSNEAKQILMNGLQEGLRGRDISEIPENLAKIIEQYQAEFGEGRLALSMRQNSARAVAEALEIIADKNAPKLERLSYIRILGEINQPTAVPVLLAIAEDQGYSAGIRLASIQSLKHYEDNTIGTTIANAYQHKIRADLDLRNECFRLFASRATWARALLSKIVDEREIKKEEVPLDIVRQIKMLDNPDLVSQVDAFWPEVKIASSSEKQQEIERVRSALQSKNGDIKTGQLIYQRSCGSCHRLFGEGGDIGPELTGYDRDNVNYLTLNIVNPNADIREGYVNYRILKTDGQVIIGTIKDRSGGNVTIKPLGGTETILSSTEIKLMEAQKMSIMPERILESLSDQEIRDLFAYLGK
ncbi:PVC-type heme-binding CxxCH protein [Reichenbachiella sp. MALMAid0571]|uniref:PVC-type heme-binding CxxCH protein n=1 Tax=Reichenbachiella sp. MALMAid0571 TaxID=3143939 RepID=UPI0032DF4883